MEVKSKYSLSVIAAGDLFKTRNRGARFEKNKKEGGKLK